MDNLSLEINIQLGDGFQQVWLDDDTSITVENHSPIFDTEAGGTFSHPFSIDAERNAHILGTSGDILGGKTYERLHGKPARLWVMGTPLSGKIHLDPEVEYADGKLSIEFASNSKELSDILDGVNAQDIDISDDKIEIGYALPEYIGLHVKAKVEEYGLITDKDGNIIDINSDYYGRKETRYYDHNIACPKILFVDWKGATSDGFTLPEREFYNVQHPYNPNNPTEHPFCNVRACYQKYVYRNNNWEKERGYSVAEPNRINSAPCFYVPYWFHKLWQRLGISVESDSLLNIADYRRLTFFHFDPQYEWGEATKLNYNRVSQSDKEKNKFDIYARYAAGHTYDTNNVVIADIDSTEGKIDPAKIGAYWINVEKDRDAELIASKHNKWSADYEGMLVHTAIANSKNFPKTDAKNILESMQTAFGARYMYDSNMGSVKVVLVRDVLRQTGSTELPCVVLNATKTEPTKVGFILKYSDAGEQEVNGITKAASIVGENAPTYSADYGADTNYNYNAYDNVIFFPKADNAANGIHNDDRALFQPNDYITLTCNVTSTDKHCYISTVTGNAFRIKVDSDAKNESELYPSLFEVGICHNFEEGDCSWKAKDEGLIEEVSIPFTPVFENDVNIANEKEVYRTDKTAPLEQRFAVLLDGEIHHKDDDSLIKESYAYGALNLKEVYDYRKNSIGQPKGWHSACHIDATLVIHSVESYAIDNDGPYYESQTDLCLAINRSSGSDAGIKYYNKNYDLEDGEVWSMSNGSHAECTIDSIDQYGGAYDYNGEAGGMGYDYNSENNFPMSLKPRAEKENPKWDPSLPATATVTLDNGTTVPNTRFFPVKGEFASGRGLGNRFYSEYAYWVLNRKLLDMDVVASASVLLGIDFTKRYRIGGIEGLVESYTYTIDINKGITKSNVKIYYL